MNYTRNGKRINIDLIDGELMEVKNERSREIER